MTLYQVMLCLHLVTIAAVFLAVGMMLSSLLRLPGCRDVRDASAALSSCSSIGKIMPVATLLLLITGGVMTQSQWSWTTPWILAGIAGLLIVTAIGGGLIARREAAIHAALETAGTGPLPQSLCDRLYDRTIFAGTGINIGIVCAIMVIMVLKGSLLASIACLALGALAGWAFATVASNRRKHARQAAAVEQSA
jgi:hypothetical protein